MLSRLTVPFNVNFVLHRKMFDENMGCACTNKSKLFLSNLLNNVSNKTNKRGTILKIHFGLKNKARQRFNA